MTIYNVTDATFQKELQGTGLTVVNFWAPWCGPCRMFAPILEAYDAAGSRDVKLIKVNVDENADIASQFGIMGIPATILFKNGKAVDKKVGVMSLEGLKQFVSKHQ